MIGYYVHHQGLGHLHRAGAITEHLTVPVTVLSSLPTRPWHHLQEWVQLPSDAGVADDDVSGDPTAGGVLHWAPTRHHGLRDRMSAISDWIRRAAPDLVVVDVSVEVALLCRLHGVPTVVMGMPGDRSDRPHRLAYDSADAVLAPWAAEFARTSWPESWRSKTFHAGSISRFDASHPPFHEREAGPWRALRLTGSGGTHGVGPGAPSVVPGWQWTVAHGLDEDEVRAAIDRADVVVTHAGQNALAEVAALSTPAVVVPEERPHGEQYDTAAVLEAAGLAVVAGPDDTWADLLPAALQLGGDGWARWRSGGGAPAAATYLDNLVAAHRSA
ncbi:glycosyl transferase [Nakamurella sp. YIM 132087]|uniref:Glycosyl transferase n=1 Tax=Nakamurella alba TaxID=2665158 RepID=A0A7K1FP65_9ACTN|nr:glycosyltransferase [Nakamurella alba]MTD14604.1 glycosyl transferase [Nakamurella alba]